MCNNSRKDLFTIVICYYMCNGNWEAIITIIHATIIEKLQIQLYVEVIEKLLTELHAIITVKLLLELLFISLSGCIIEVEENKYS